MALAPSSPDPPQSEPADPSSRPRLDDFKFAKVSTDTGGKRRKRRSRHSGGRAEHSIWQFGAGAIPPVALVGLTLAVLGFIRQDFLNAPIMKIGIGVICGVIVIGLATIFYGLNPDSRRLHRREVWLGLILGITTLLALGSMLLKDHIIAMLSPPAPAASTATS